jgi:hypothetical protein
VLKPIDQRVDQRLLVEQPVPVRQIESGDDCRDAVIALIPINRKNAFACSGLIVK